MQEKLRKITNSIVRAAVMRGDVELVGALGLNEAEELEAIKDALAMSLLNGVAVNLVPQMRAQLEMLGLNVYKYGNHLDTALLFSVKTALATMMTDEQIVAHLVEQGENLDDIRVAQARIGRLVEAGYMIG